MKNLFEISNLKCSYNKNDIVLKINKLNIPKGKLTVILGKSGAGKSTILETLGLMNNTILSESILNFFPKEDRNTVFQFNKIWNSKDKNPLFYIRQNYFSFIFQDTNLMPNFTAYENICISQMIQGKSYNDSVDNAKKMMDIIGLGEIGKSKKAHELSGGQKQRLAFVRAITPEFTVLFGDEPTGNLDEHNSRELLTILKENLKDNNRSAIIVSHNVSLSVEFADYIVIINKENGFGEVHDYNTYVAQYFDNIKIWKNSNNIEVKDLNITINQIISN
jgi:lipoprotein-releasing system ATP-binding protein